MAQNNLSRHSPRPYDGLGVNWSSPTLARREGSHHRASSSVRTTSPGLNSASRSNEELLHERAPTSTPEHQLGSPVLATDPEHHAFVTSGDPGNAVDAHVVSFEPKPVSGADDDLDFRPTILQPLSITILICLHTLVAVGIGIMLWRAGTAQQFYISSENVHMIARYFPSVVGTATVLLFQQTVREFLRMRPYIAMADQDGVLTPGAVPWRSVSGGFFPWQDVFVTPGFTSWLSLFCHFIASFIVSLKVALLATTLQPRTPDKNANWTLTMRTYPALALIGGYILMATYTAFIGFQLKGTSTGLKWDPVSIADFISLFAKCNALKYFAPLELQHETKAKQAMSVDQRFRLGYWVKHSENSPPEIVYGIGVGFGDSHRGKGAIGNNGSRAGGELNRSLPKPLLPNTTNGCTCEKWPKCEHYPYRHNPGVARWFLVLCTLIVWAMFGLSIYALVKHLPMQGFSVPNNWSLPTEWNVTTSVGNHTISLFQRPEAKPTLLVYALLFRSLPTYAAGLFINTIIPALDLNMRFMEPFVSMFEEPGKASETVLLAYITLSPLQVPLTAYDKGHYKVSWFSTLNTLSPLFPIFVGGLLTISAKGDRVSLSFSLSAYIGIMVSLALYGLSLPFGFPHPHRLLPRQFYSLADLMAMCHESRFLSRPCLDIASRKVTPTKAHMEARILLSRAEFLFGIYTGRDGRPHLGFDVAKIAMNDPNKAESTGLVQWIPPHGRLWNLSPRGRAYTTKVSTMARMERGKGNYAPLNTGYGPAEGARRAYYEEYEMDAVSTEVDPPTPSGARPREPRVDFTPPVNGP